MDQIFFSLIIPVYNRPDEIKELLESLKQQSYNKFEVIVVEDGSKEGLRCEEIVKAFENNFAIKYFFKENSGQGFARNFAFERASGDYFIIFDSDVIIPPQYLKVVNNTIQLEKLDAFGGPDAAASDFNDIQKAISYSMTSLFTTGGIRGNKKHVGQFHPRSFNMGLSRKVYEKVGGFKTARLAEDIELSLRTIKAGFKVALIPEAFVYHKRRSTFLQFFKQCFSFGRGRINTTRFHKGQLKAVHFFPLAFTTFLLFIPVLFLFNRLLFLISLFFLFAYLVIILIDSATKNKKIKIGLLSVIASCTQLLGYGFGFLSEGLKKIFEKQSTE